MVNLAIMVATRVEVALKSIANHVISGEIWEKVPKKGRNFPKKGIER